MASDLIQKLFTWRKKVQLADDIFVYMRVVPDRVMEEARTKGLLEANKLRRDLRNPETDSFLLYMETAEHLTDEELIDQIMGMQAVEVLREYRSKTPLPALPELSEYPTQEEQENYEVAKSKREEDYLTTLKTYLDTWQKDFVKPLQKAPRERLIALWRKYRTDRLAEERMTTVFDDYILLHSLYLDEKYTQLAFTEQEFWELPTDIKSILVKEYINLRMDANELKK